jgi:5'(3')-deoxyribonucleotidase
MEKGNGLRYNTNKNRLGLIPTDASEGIGDVLTYGANKYTYTNFLDDNGNIIKTEKGIHEGENVQVITGANNWRLGMKWSTVIDSLERHLLAFKNGEDNDPESGCMHIDHILTNAAFLRTYYRVYPQGDDRLHPYLNTPRIGLDIDDCLNNFVEEYCKKYNLDLPNSWHFDRKMPERLKELKKDKNFWLNIKPKINPKDLKFEPTCYITARSIPVEWTEEWLDKYGFPVAKVHSVGFDMSKAEIAKKENLDFFIDDRFENFLELNKNGICTLLLDTHHNKKFDVGYKRIKDFNDFYERFLK